VFCDYYNANPDSMKAAFAIFQDAREIPSEVARVPCSQKPDNATMSKLYSEQNSGRLIFVLGSMLELGEESEHAHKDIGRAALKSNPRQYFCLVMR